MAAFALTFDDGPGPSTAALLDILADASVAATFFVLGRNVAEAPWGDATRAQSLVVRALGDGHVVGNHTYSHARPEDHLGLPADLRRADEIILACRRQAGLPVHGTPPVRLPYGIRLVPQTVAVPTGTLHAGVLDPRLAVLASLGRTHVHWTADFSDWKLTAEGGAQLASRLVQHVEEIAALGLSAVLDLHDGGTGSSWGYDRQATVTAVSLFLAEARHRAWTAFTVPTEAASPTS